MAQFDVYRNPNPQSKEFFPYLLDIQSDLHKDLISRLAVPMAVDTKPFGKLTPVFEIEGQKVALYVMDTTSVYKDALQEKIANLEEHRSEIIDALDFLINGF